MIPRIAQWRPERLGANVILADTTGTRAGPGAPPAGPPRPSFEPEPQVRSRSPRPLGQVLGGTVLWDATARDWAVRWVLPGLVSRRS